MRNDSSPGTTLKWMSPRVPRNTEEKKAHRRERLTLSLFCMSICALLVVGGQIAPESKGRHPSLIAGIALIAFFGPGLYLLHGPGSDKCDRKSCKLDKREVRVSQLRLKHREIRHACLWIFEGQGQSFRMLSFIRRNWLIAKVAVAPEVSDADVRACLGQTFLVLDRAPTEGERALDRLAKPTWRSSLGILLLGIGLIAALGIWAAGSAALAPPAPVVAGESQSAGASQPPTAPEANVATSRPQASGRQVQGRGQFLFSLFLLLAFAVVTMALLVAGALLILWDKIHGLRQRADYLADMTLRQTACMSTPGESHAQGNQGGTPEACHEGV